MDKFVLTANLVEALHKYLVSKPFGEVANLVLALQQQVSAQQQQETVGGAPEQSTAQQELPLQ